MTHHPHAAIPHDARWLPGAYPRWVARINYPAYRKKTDRNRPR
jgi:hypothetical protein